MFRKKSFFHVDILDTSPCIVIHSLTYITITISPHKNLLFVVSRNKCFGEKSFENCTSIASFTLNFWTDERLEKKYMLVPRFEPHGSSQFYHAE